MGSKDADRMVNSVDLGLHCLPRPVCLKTWDHYGTFQTRVSLLLRVVDDKFMFQLQ